MIRIDQFDTITAVSTPPGAGAIGIVRVSGPQAEEVGRKLFHPGKPVETFESHRLYHGRLVALRTGAVIDEVLLTVMRGPHSFTGEDVLEIHCHGGPAILETILGETLKAGARMARPGEFTERAFLNGRLDLVQAEAIMDMILAKTGEGLRQALSQFGGRLSAVVQALRSELLDLLARVEASIDFPEEGVDALPEELALRAASVSGRIEELLATYRAGRVFREGLSLVITGKTNVGKSSLLNRLLGEERAIVTPVAGTTRDFIAETINLGGIPVTLMDTAGIRDSDDEIELKGMEKVWEKLDTADIVVLVLDGSARLDGQDREIIRRISGKTIIVAVNKKDLPEKISEEEIRGHLPGADLLHISAKYNDGMDELKGAIYRIAAGDAAERREAVISNVRHKDALERARDLLTTAMQNMDACLGIDLVACDLREAAESLGDIIGETTSEDVLEKIFSTFCIGK